MTKCIVGLCVAFALMGSFRASAFIDPSFTPKDLIEVSKTILSLKFSEIDPETGTGTATVAKNLKGDKTGPIVFDFKNAVERGVPIAGMINAGWTTGMFFAGMEGGYPSRDAGFGEDGPDGVLLVRTLWCEMYRNEDGSWEMGDASGTMPGTWASHDRMLHRAVVYGLDRGEDADFPVATSATWNDKIPLDTIEGVVHATAAVDLQGQGFPYLFIAAAQGDRLFAFRDNKPVERTADVGLNSRSARFAWGDFNRNGKLDLASWTGTELHLFYHGENGMFAAGERIAFEIESCNGLSAFDGGEKGVGLLIDTGGIPAVFYPGGDAPPEPIAANLPAGERGDPGEVVVADFDGSGFPDVLHLYERSSLLYRAKALGAFEPPVESNAYRGNGPAAVTLGDFDMDGRLDLYVSSGNSLLIWRNLGDGQFEQMHGMSGEIDYIDNLGAVAAFSGDVDNDGRQDIAILYANDGLKIFFNRGFHAFGHGRQLNIDEETVLPQSRSGQTTGCWADFVGNGSLDLVVVLKDGQTWLLTQFHGDDGYGRGAVVNMPVSSQYAGPLRVTAWLDDQCLGAVSMRAGDAGIVFGAVYEGEITLKWQMPGGEEITRSVLVEQDPERVAVGF